MITVFIIHGTYGTPKEHWFPWLHEELQKLGYTVFVPKFPHPPKHNLKNWMKEFQKYRRYLSEKCIFIGHSIGCAFILSLLEELNQNIKACFFVAGFLKKINVKKFVELNKTFFEIEFDWKRIQKKM